jgi:hypothetical protein
MRMSDEPIGLAEAIRRVRTELADARSEGEGADLRFRLGEVQLQFEVQLTREGAGEAGIKLWVVSVGAKGRVTSGQTHTVTVSMVPQARVGADWQDVMVGEEVAARPPASGAGRGA